MRAIRSKRTGRIRIQQFTDTHLHADSGKELYGLDTERSLRQVLAKAREAAPAPDLILLTGDLVHDGSSHGYRRLAGYMGERGVPAYALAGNHDAPATMASIFQGLPVDYRDTLTIGAWLLVFLNSHLPGSDAGALGGKQLEQLRALLDDCQNRHVLLCLHHQPVPVGSPWIDRIGLQDAAELWQVLERRPEVRGILWGHIHQDYTGEAHGVRLLGSPSTCVQFAPRCDDFRLDDIPPAYRWLELAADGAIETGIVHCPLPDDHA